ncbi:MAG: tetratricopeptide repeat protein, partial [Verrucomicrobiota bacterium]|nr:tetratricopeptide repeat protein [Verrucomicrobiota bacterium]
TKLADELIAYILEQVPHDLTKDANISATRDYYYTIAAIHSNARRDKEGLAAYEALGKMIGVDDGLRSKQASWHRNRKRYAQARRIYSQYKDREAGLAATADSWYEEKKWAEAVNVYNQLIGLDKKKEGEWQQAIVGVWRKAGEWDKAIATYRILLTVDAGEFGDWYWGIADCYERTGRLKEAIHSYRQSDRYPTVYFAMASCHRRLKQYKEALVLYHQARADKGAAPEATKLIAETYEQSGARENAIKWFQQTCKLYPKTSQASRSHAHLQSKYKISVTLGGANEKE